MSEICREFSYSTFPNEFYAKGECDVAASLCGRAMVCDFRHTQKNEKETEKQKNYKSFQLSLESFSGI